MESKFTNEQLVAIAKLVDDKSFKAASGQLPVGPYEVDFVLRVHGTFNKGKDYEQKYVAKADPWGLLALALSKLNGVTVESLVAEHLRLKEAKTDGDQRLKERADEAIQKVKAPTYQVANGKVSSVQIEAVGIPVVSVEDVSFGRRAPYAVTEEVA